MAQQEVKGRAGSDSDTSESGTESDASVDDIRQGQGLLSWVACDLCSKWRRVPAAVADALKDDTPWYCEQNPNKAFASCSVPQELTNEQIDALEEDAEEAEEVLDDGALFEERARRKRMPAVWQLIRDNVLTHRKRKVQEEDDVMICNCKPPWRGGDCCGPDCINRMLCVECVAGFCPSEDKCTNQAFTRKQYAKLEVRRAGAKGFGLFALEPITAGQFIIEYIGEVLEEEEYLRRKDFYAEIGTRHYYFMNIGNGEVIDAARKGNRARFINHSCDPNCETQKWLVRGELAIGLFATKDIGVGEELTFDYNFERYGDKPIRCYCATKACRKYIGGTQDTYDAAVIVVDPEDASNDWQPIMLVDGDMDWASRALLDWRVGTSWDPDKEGQVLARLERICKSRGVPWTPAHYYGQLAAPAMEGLVAMPEPSAASGGAGAVSGGEPSAGGGKTGGRKLGTRQRAAKGKSRAGKEAGSDAEAEGGEGDDGEAETGPSGGRGKLTRLRRGAAAAGKEEEKAEEKPGAGQGPNAVALAVASKAPMLARKRAQLAAASQKGSGAASSSQVSAATEVKDPTQRGAFKGGAAMSAADSDGVKPPPGVDTDREAHSSKLEDDALAGLPLPSARPGSQGAPRPRRPFGAAGSGMRVAGFRRRSEIDRRLESLLGPSGRLREASKPNIIKVLRMFNLCDIGPNKGAQRLATSAPSGATAGPALPDTSADAQTGEAGGAPSAAEPGTATGPEATVTAGVGVGVAGHRLTASGTAGGITAEAVDGTLAAPSDADMTSAGADGAEAAVKPEEVEGAVTLKIEPALAGEANLGVVHAPAPAAPAPLPVDRTTAGFSQPVIMTARQRARMVDLSLLLDVILKTSSATVRKDFVACGVLNQLHQAIGRNFAKEYSVIVRKVLRVLGALPLTADDLHGTRTAHGTLAETLQELTSNQDYEVRAKAASLLAKYPVTACRDPVLLARLTAPRRRVATGFSPALPPGSLADQPTGRPPLARVVSAAELPATSGPSPSPYPGYAQSSPLVAGSEAEGPDTKRPRLGSSNLLPRVPEGGPPHDGSWAGQGPTPPPGAAGHAARAPAGPLPYSYRHGSALLDFKPGNEPPPPPLDAEELFELLLVPVSELRLEPGYQDPVPPVQPTNVPAEYAFGERSDMEVLFAVGVYETDWAAAASAIPPGPGPKRRARRDAGKGGGGRDRDRDREWESGSEGVPMSPVRNPPELTMSPAREEGVEEERAAAAAAAAAAEQQRLATLQQQAQHQQHHGGMRWGYGGVAQGPGGMRHGVFGAGGGPGGDTAGAGGLGGMPLVVDLRAGPGSTAGWGTANAAAQQRLPSPLPIPEGYHRGGYPLRPESPGLLPPHGGLRPTSVTPPIDPDLAEWARPMRADFPESWDEPDDAFESFAVEAIRYRLGKYVTTPDHPHRISSEDAHALFKKICREVMQKERQAYQDRQAQGLYKLIEKRKVEHNMKEFVRLSIRRFHTQAAGGVPPGAVPPPPGG